MAQHSSQPSLSPSPTRDVHSPFKVERHPGDDWTEIFAPGSTGLARFVRWSNENGEHAMRMPAVAVNDISHLVMYTHQHEDLLQSNRSHILGPVMEMHKDVGRLLCVVLCPVAENAPKDFVLVAFEKQAGRTMTVDIPPLAVREHLIREYNAWFAKAFSVDSSEKNAGSLQVARFTADTCELEMDHIMPSVGWTIAEVCYQAKIFMSFNRWKKVVQGPQHCCLF